MATTVKTVTVRTCDVCYAEIQASHNSNKLLELDNGLTVECTLTLARESGLNLPVTGMCMDCFDSILYKYSKAL